MAIRIQLRRDTADNWASANPVLLAGELGIETDTLKIKIGDGSNWNSISSYANTTPSDLTSSLGDYILASDRNSAGGVAGLDSSNNLLVPGTSIIVEGSTDNAYETTLTLVDPTADRTITFQDASGTVAHISNVNDALTTASNDATTKANDAVTTAAAYTDNEIDVLHTTLTGEISTHNLDTTSVHGISNTADLATKTYADNAATTAANSAQLAAEQTASTNLSSHQSDATNVHGIADTSLLATQSYADTAAGLVEDQLADYAPLAGATFTGGITVPSVDVSGQISAGSLVVDGNLTVSGTTTSLNTLNINLRDNLIYLNEAVDKTVTNAVGDGTSVTYTIDNADGTFVAGNVARVTDITPSGLNASWSEIISTTSTSFTITKSDTDTYVSGGTAYTKASINPDLGFVGGYNDGTYYHSGLVRDASSSAGTWILFDGNPAEPGASVDFSTYNRAPLEVGPLHATGASIGDVTNTELQYVHGVTSAIQTQLDGKQEIVSGVSSTEIGYLDGVTSAIQTQLNSKSPIDAPTFTGKVTVSSSGIEFADGIQTKQGVPSITPISTKTANYTLSSLAERDTMIEFNSSSDVAITIPPAADINYPVGSSIDISNINTGLVTVVAGSGVTVNATPGLKLRTQWSTATLFKRGSDTWLVYGDLKA